MTLDERKEMFGNGPYSPLMGELYSDCQLLLGLSPKQSERVAKAYGADLGKLTPEQKVQIGKMNKSGRLTLKAVSTFKLAIMTNSMALAKTCALLYETRTYGVENATIELSQAMQEWLNKPATEQKKHEEQKETVAA